MSTLQKQFAWNQVPYEVLDRFESWILVKGTRLTPSGPITFYDCGNVRSDEQGDEIPPATLGMQDEKHMRDLAYTRKRFEAGKDKILTDRLRKEKTLQETRNIEIAEQKRIDFLSGIEEKKRHCLQEIHDLYDKSTKVEGLTSNKRFHELMTQIAEYENFRFFFRHPITKL